MYPDRGYIRESTVDTIIDTNITTTTATHSAIQNEIVYVHTLVACFSLCTGSYDGVSC